MKRFYVITNRQKDPKLAVTGMLCDFLKSRGKECVLESEGRQNLVYKHAISTVIPSRYISILDKECEEGQDD